MTDKFLINRNLAVSWNSVAKAAPSAIPNVTKVLHVGDGVRRPHDDRAAPLTPALYPAHIQLAQLQSDPLDIDGRAEPSLSTLGDHAPYGANFDAAMILKGRKMFTVYLLTTRIVMIKGTLTTVSSGSRRRHGGGLSQPCCHCVYPFQRSRCRLR